MLSAPKCLLLVTSLGFILGMSACTVHQPLSQITSPEREMPLAAPVLQSVPAGVTPEDALHPDPALVRQRLDQQDIAGAVAEIESGWKKHYENYYQINTEAPLMRVEVIAQVLAQNNQLTGRKAALIYAVPTPQALELILITAEGQPIHARVDEATQENLTATIKTFRTAIVDPRTSSTTYLLPAQQLYQWLIKPLEAELTRQNVDTLIFCLGSQLRSTPLAALQDGQQFLAEKYKMAIIPAFSLLDQRPTPLRNTQVLAMGASQFQDLAALPAVPVELSVIAGQWQGTELLNQQFTVSNLTQARSRYPYGIVHLATHAQFSPGAADQSYIQFWDQRLSLSQLTELNLHAPTVQLLVLSACRTALGDSNAELGFAGLAVQSGSQAAIASLWSVNDLGTLVLMSELYDHLRNTPIKAEALQQAQINLLKRQISLDLFTPTRQTSENAPVQTDSVSIQQIQQTDFSHPYYWAAFTLIGNPW